MKNGSLIVPIEDYKKLADKYGFIITPFYPNPSTICTIKNINGIGLDVEECVAAIAGEIHSFNIAYWREIQAPEEVNIEELMEQSKNYQLQEIENYL